MTSSQNFRLKLVPKQIKIIVEIANDRVHKNMNKTIHLYNIPNNIDEPFDWENSNTLRIEIRTTRSKKT